MAKTHPADALPAPPQINLKRLARLRVRDGDNCWLCRKPLRFDGKPGRGLAATIEHHLARCLGGGNGLNNLLLCHAVCNRILGDRTPEQKERLRARWARRRARR